MTTTNALRHIAACACFMLAFAVPPAAAAIPGKVTRSFKAPIVLEGGSREVVQVTEITQDALICGEGADERAIPWADIRAQSAYDAMRKAADRKDPTDWVWIGIKMLELDEIGRAHV